jgi:hypothetical protein
MAITDAPAKVASQFATSEEGRALFDEAARREMNMSGEECIRRWDRGEFRGIDSGPEHVKLMRLVMLMPFGRQDS